MLANVIELLRFGHRRSREELAAALPITGHLLTAVVDNRFQAQLLANGTGTGSYRASRIAILNPLLQVQLEKVSQDGFALRGTQRVFRHGEMYEFMQIWWAVPHPTTSDDPETSDPFTHPECSKLLQEAWERGGLEP